MSKVLSIFATAGILSETVVNLMVSISIGIIHGRKYGWNCIAKKKKFKKPGNPYKAFENLINKNWLVDKPICKLTTDITYLPFDKSILYLSTIMDTFNSEIVAY